MAACSRNGSQATAIARSCWWVYEYLFAKQDRAKIDDDELKALRTLAKAYAELTEGQVASLIADKDWIEICKPDSEER